MKAKQKDILKLLKPCTMSVTTPEQGLKVIRLDEFLAKCIYQYKVKTGAVNISYNVEYLKQNESEV